MVEAGIGETHLEAERHGTPEPRRKSRGNRLLTAPWFQPSQSQNCEGRSLRSETTGSVLLPSSSLRKWTVKEIHLLTHFSPSVLGADVLRA